MIIKNKLEFKIVKVLRINVLSNMSVCNNVQHGFQSLYLLARSCSRHYQRMKIFWRAMLALLWGGGRVQIVLHALLAAALCIRRVIRQFKLQTLSCLVRYGADCAALVPSAIRHAINDCVAKHKIFICKQLIPIVVLRRKPLHGPAWLRWQNSLIAFCEPDSGFTLVFSRNRNNFTLAKRFMIVFLQYIKYDCACECCMCVCVLVCVRRTSRNLVFWRARRALSGCWQMKPQSEQEIDIKPAQTYIDGGIAKACKLALQWFNIFRTPFLHVAVSSSRMCTLARRDSHNVSESTNLHRILCERRLMSSKAIAEHQIVNVAFSLCEVVCKKCRPQPLGCLQIKHSRWIEKFEGSSSASKLKVISTTFCNIWNSHSLTGLQKR